VKKYDSNWEPEVAKLPVVISFPGSELKSRDVVVGVEVNGVSRAYPWEKLVKQSPVMDRITGKPILIAVAADGKSFRAFVSRIDDKDTEFFLKGDSDNDTSETPKGDAAGVSARPAPQEAAGSGPHSETGKPVAASAPKPWILLDATTASEWNFRGCAISGPAQGKCLERLPALKDYWFNWRNYHPETTIYKR